MARDSGPSTNKWHDPAEEPYGGQNIAVDENGMECCAFYHDGKWYYCTNVAHPDNEFDPRGWMPLPQWGIAHG